MDILGGYDISFSAAVVLMDMIDGAGEHDSVRTLVGVEALLDRRLEVARFVFIEPTVNRSNKPSHCLRVGTGISASRSANV